MEEENQLAETEGLGELIRENSSWRHSTAFSARDSIYRSLEAGKFGKVESSMCVAICLRKFQHFRGFSPWKQREGKARKERKKSGG